MAVRKGGSSNIATERDLSRLLEASCTRRQFLALSAAGSAALAGCAVNPVTGQQQLMLVSEQQEIAIDRQNSPHQLSSDYGIANDRALTAYIEEIGRRLAPLTHRPAMPYRVVPVNAVYVNAYAFPGGTIGITRGILLGLESEAALASLVGHEMGHVNARHTAQQMSKGMLSSLVIAGASAYLGSATGYADLASNLGQIASGALLASYSRDNERQADALGLEYMMEAGYNPHGQVELMDLLRSLHKRQPSALELMFATHPMSDERYETVVSSIAAMPPSVKDLPTGTERYMDKTASLRSRKQRAAIEEMQKGEKELGARKYEEARSHFRQALAHVDDDYAGLLLMAKAQYGLEDFVEMDRFATSAREAYPAEAQAWHIGGMAKLLRKKYDEGYGLFRRSGEVLPGNPNVIFFMGLCREKMQRIEAAATHYDDFLKKGGGGDYARYAQNRLREWGYR